METPSTEMTGLRLGSLNSSGYFRLECALVYGFNGMILLMFFLQHYRIHMHMFENSSYHKQPHGKRSCYNALIIGCTMFVRVPCFGSPAL